MYIYKSVNQIILRSSKLVLREGQLALQLNMSKGENIFQNCGMIKVLCAGPCNFLALAVRFKRKSFFETLNTVRP